MATSFCNYPLVNQAQILEPKFPVFKQKLYFTLYFFWQFIAAEISGCKSYRNTPCAQHF